ncbi:MAG: OsmC family protein [Dehalococcoidia bacterium]
MASRAITTTVSARHVVRDQVEVTMGRHSLLIDHPVSMDGDDMGPSPVETLLAALAGCKAVTVVRYARRKGYRLESVEVRIPGFALDHDRIDGPVHALIRVSQIEAVVQIKGDITEEQRKELEAVAHSCPVSETLSRGVAIDQRVVLAKE